MPIADPHLTEAKRPTLFSTSRQAFDADQQILACLERRIATAPRRAEGPRPGRVLLAAAAVLIVAMIAALAVLAREAGSGRQLHDAVAPQRGAARSAVALAVGPQAHAGAPAAKSAAAVRQGPPRPPAAPNT